MSRRTARAEAPVGAGASARLAAAFVGLGATGAVLPASLPSLAAASAADRVDVFLAVPMLFAGLLVGVVVAALLSGLADLARLLSAGAGLQAGALVAVAAAPDAAGVVVSAGVAGIGFGLVESAGVGLARRLNPEGAGQALTRLTSLVAVTAMLVPLLVVATGTFGSVRAVIALCALPHLLALVLLVREGPAGAGRPAGGPGADGGAPPSGSGLLWPALALFCYVGAESVVAGWSAELPRRLVGLDPAVAALGTSLFWGLLWAGRLGALRALRRGATERAVVYSAQAAAVVLLVLAASFAQAAPVASGLLLAAAVPALAPSYGLLLSVGLRRAGGATGRTSAVLVAVGALGGSALTLLANRAAARTDDDSAAVTLAVAAAAAGLSLLAASRASGTAGAHAGLCDGAGP